MLKNITISLGKDVVGISNLIKSAVITMKEDIATMRENITGVMETLETVKGDVETVKGDVETVKEDVKAMKEDIETVKTDVEDVKEDIEDVKDDVDDIEDDIEDVKDDMECVKSDIETVKSDMETMKNDVMVVKSEVETVKGDVDTVKNDVAAMKSDLDMVKNDTGMVKSEVETVTRYVERMKNDVVVVKNDMETVKGDMEMVKSDVWMVKNDVGVLKSEVETVKGDVETVKSDVDSIKSELENATETTEQDMETVKSNLTGLYIKLEQVQQICSGTELQTPPTLPSETPPTPTATPTPLVQPPSEPSDPGYICNDTSGWKRVVYLNMTDTSHHCPTGWRETGYSRRTCGRASTGEGTCDSVIFPVSGMEYTRVCGRVLGYQFGSVSAFYSSSHNIESHYVNGLSLTRGSAGSREHIWTLAGGLAESGPHYSGEWCPCDGGTSPVPEFVGNDYFCESGINGPWINYQWIFHPNDPLWDGMNCLPTSSCCTLNDPPYFAKDIGHTTTDDIEARICSRARLQVSDVAIELVELYVQ